MLDLDSSLAILPYFSEIKPMKIIFFDYFFNIPTHVPITYTLKSTKFTLKH